MDDSDYKMWKQRGVLLQLNLPSLVGAYGPMVQRKAEWLLKENLYDYCGTDTHSIDQMRMFLNSEISKKTAKKVKRISDSQKL
jgi:tyrosine-protein phosphatase YwqE